MTLNDTDGGEEEDEEADSEDEKFIATDDDETVDGNYVHDEDQEHTSDEERMEELRLVAKSRRATTEQKKKLAAKVLASMKDQGCHSTTTRSRVKAKQGVILDDSDIDDDSEANDEHSTSTSTSTRRKKSKVRAAGIPPTSARQQVDNKVKEKLRALGTPVLRLMQQSTPLAKLDGPHKLTEGEVREQMNFPDVIFGIYCYTEQKPNADGNSKSLFLDTPEIRFLTASKKMSTVLNKKIRPVVKKSTGNSVCQMATFEDFTEFLATFNDAKTLEHNKSKSKGGSRNQQNREYGMPSKKSNMFKEGKAKEQQMMARKRRKIMDDEEDEE